MNEFIDKLIERLEEEKKYCSYNPQIRDKAINKAIEIVNQLAEEYKDTNIQTIDVSELLGVYQSTPITNADHIRSMGDKELSEFLAKHFYCEHICPARTKTCYLDCTSAVKAWLGQKSSR